MTGSARRRSLRLSSVYFGVVRNDDVNVRVSGLTAVSVTACVTRTLYERLRLSALFGLSVAVFEPFEKITRAPTVRPFDVISRSVLAVTPRTRSENVTLTLAARETRFVPDFGETRTTRGAVKSVLTRA
jgi:hypothetical protein